MTSDLLKLYHQGFVPGPSESSEAFERRIETTCAFRKDPSSVAKRLGFCLDSFSSPSPSILSFRTNQKLSVFVGALTWIVETEDNISVPFLQLPKRRRLFYLSDEELIAHEKVHIARTTFNEPKFEEFLAYRQNTSLFRKLFGPLIQSPKESYLFVLTLIPPLAVMVFNPDWILWSYLPLLAGTLLSTIRLVQRHRTLTRALKYLKSQYQNGEELLLLMTDREITSLARGKNLLFEGGTLREDLIHKLKRKRLTDPSDQGI